MMHSPVRLSFTAPTTTSVPQFLPRTPIAASLPTPTVAHLHTTSPHNSPKHVHKVIGVHRAKHQVEYVNAPHTKHHLHMAKSPVRVVRSPVTTIVNNPQSPIIRPAMKSTLLPSQESVPDFFTYSPFDGAFPRFSQSYSRRSLMTSPKNNSSSFVSRAVNMPFSPPKRESTVQRTQQQTIAAAAVQTSEQLSMIAAMKSLAPTAASKKTKTNNISKPLRLSKAIPVVARISATTNTSTRRRLSSRQKRMNLKRLQKEHTHQIPKFVYNTKKWHFAGYVSVSPFDTNFPKICKLSVSVNNSWRPAVGTAVSSSISKQEQKSAAGPRSKTHGHHRHGVTHHAGHHPAGHHKAAGHLNRDAKDALLMQNYYQATMAAATSPVAIAAPVLAMTPVASSFVSTAKPVPVTRMSSQPFPRISPTAASSPATRPSFFGTPTDSGILLGYNNLPGSMMAIPRVTRNVSANVTRGTSYRVSTVQQPFSAIPLQNQSVVGISQQPSFVSYGSRTVQTTQPSLVASSTLRQPAVPSSAIGSFSSVMW